MDILYLSLALYPLLKPSSLLNHACTSRLLHQVTFTPKDSMNPPRFKSASNIGFLSWEILWRWSVYNIDSHASLSKTSIHVLWVTPCTSHLQLSQRVIPSCLFPRRLHPESSDVQPYYRPRTHVDRYYLGRRPTLLSSVHSEGSSRRRRGAPLLCQARGFSYHPTYPRASPIPCPMTSQ